MTAAFILMLWFALNGLFVCVRLFTVYVIDQAEERRWRRLHPHLDWSDWR